MYFSVMSLTRFHEAQSSQWDGYMTALAEMGAILLPPVPAFYAEPRNLADLVDQMVGRAMDFFGYDWPHVKRWGEELAKGRRNKRDIP